MLNPMKRDPILLENLFNKIEFSNVSFGHWLMMFLKKKFKKFWMIFLIKTFSRKRKVLLVLKISILVTNKKSNNKLRKRLKDKNKNNR